MIFHDQITDSAVRAAIRHQTIRLAGNIRDKIFGRLNCRSGRRMKRVNRVFFADEAEALAHGFRPCGHCMREDYAVWKVDRTLSEPAPLPERAKLV
jgi:hypothetical protein